MAVALFRSSPSRRMRRPTLPCHFVAARPPYLPSLWAEARSAWWLFTLGDYAFIPVAALCPLRYLSPSGCAFDHNQLIRQHREEAAKKHDEEKVGFDFGHLNKLYTGDCLYYKLSAVFSSLENKKKENYRSLLYKNDFRVSVRGGAAPNNWMSRHAKLLPCRQMMHMVLLHEIYIMVCGLRRLIQAAWKDIQEERVGTMKIAVCAS